MMGLAKVLELPLVSVVIPSYNHAQYLRECIDSVLNQSYTRIEVIVVDDGSTDESLDLLRSYGDRIRLLQQCGGRQARARNMALAAATGELVAFLDSDDRYIPERIDAAVAAFLQHPETDVVWGDFRLIDGRGKALRDVRWKPRLTDFRLELISGNPICNAVATVRRSAIEAIGGFDERTPRACDGAAWYQIAALGGKFLHLDQVLLEYRIHGANDSRGFVGMTLDRDTALVSAVRAFVQNEVIVDPHIKRWVRRQLIRQFAFRAAAEAQRSLSTRMLSRATATVLEHLGSPANLQMLAFMRRLRQFVKGQVAESV
jgi:glycosyltransferase involved in cell wall biosynthesis